MQPQPPWAGHSAHPPPGQQYPAAHTHPDPYQSYMYSAPPVYSTSESGNGAPRYSHTNYPTYHQPQGYTDINRQQWHGCEPVPDRRYGEMWHKDYREAAAASSSYVSYGVVKEAPYRPVECDTHNRRDPPPEAEAGTVSQSESEPGKKHDDTYTTRYQELSSVDLILAEKQPSYHEHQEQRIPEAVCPAPSSERGKMKESSVEGAPATTRSEYTDSFLAKVQKFVVRNAEAFDAISERSDVAPLIPTLHDEKTEDSLRHAEPDALEYVMQISTDTRKKRFFELVAVGDVVRGHVTAKRAEGMSVTVTSFVKSHKHRELSDMDIKGVVPFKNVSDTYEKREEVISETELDDVIQAVVMKVYPQDELLTLSFLKDDLPDSAEDIHLGYIEGMRPVNPRSGFIHREDFLHRLKDDPGFTNPHCEENLKSVLGLNTPELRPSLLREVQLAEYPQSEYYDTLRKAQRGKWSMEIVAIGVKYFKSGAHSTAMKYFNHALEIDGENVEGLVARGALLANNGKYANAITDFEAALTIKHTHSNARKYLVDTQVAYGLKLEKEGRVDSAMRCFREALADDPEEETARTRLQILTAAKEKQAAEQRERERKKAEEKATLKKLQKIIEKEKMRKERRSKPKKKKKVKISRKHKKKVPKKEYYSSDESTATATDSSGSHSSGRSRSPSPPSDWKSRRKERHSSGRSRSPSPPSDWKSRRKERHSKNSRSRSRSQSPRRKERLRSVSEKSRRSRSRSRSPPKRLPLSDSSSEGESRRKSKSRQRSDSERSRKHHRKYKT